MDQQEGYRITEFLRESNAIEEVFDHQSLKDALEAWNYIVQQNRLTKANILETHRVLMKNQGLEKRDLGAVRIDNVSVGGKLMPAPYYVETLLDAWIERVNDTMEEVNRGFVTKDKVAENIRMDHIVYESYHPFIDGNGRTGRIFLNWQRVKIGLPVLIIKSATKHDEYYPWFEER